MRFIILGVLFILLGFSFLIIFIEDENKLILFLGAFKCTIGGAMIMKGIYETDMKYTPTAIDVYKGKTTLQITYKDSIPVDSVVVFKEKGK